jgi:hypothetical protein
MSQIRYLQLLLFLVCWAKLKYYADNVQVLKEVSKGDVRNDKFSVVYEEVLDFIYQYT